LSGKLFRQIPAGAAEQLGEPGRPIGQLGNRAGHPVEPERRQPYLYTVLGTGVLGAGRPAARSRAERLPAARHPRLGHIGHHQRIGELDHQHRPGIRRLVPHHRPGGALAELGVLAHQPGERRIRRRRDRLPGADAHNFILRHMTGWCAVLHLIAP
jgi:hypothetical protein